MKASEAHGLRDANLLERLKEAREELFSLRFQHATGELEDTAKLARAKRDVARLLTVAKQRGIDLEKEVHA